MKFLTITNSESHVESESFYPMMGKLFEKGHCSYVLDVSSIGNEAFYNEHNSSIISAFIVDSGYSFESHNNYLEKAHDVNEIEFDAVLIRIDRPVSDSFLRHIETIFSNSIIVNSPEAIIDTSSKEYLVNFSEYCPEMHLCDSVGAVLKFSKIGPIVLKPLKNYGGKGLYKFIDGTAYRENMEVSLSTFISDMEEIFSRNDKLLAVEYLKNIQLGDKRILVVNKKIVGAFNRVPAENSWLANVSQGAKFEKCDISQREKEMAVGLAEKLYELGIVIFGLDVIKGDDMTELLSEINTLNVGGFYQVEALEGNGCINETINLLCEYVTTKMAKLN